MKKDMNWIKGFYSKTGTWWGPAESKISDRDHRRAATIRKLCGADRKTVLELGSGYGNTAAATAEAGYNTTGVEISDRADFSKQFTEQSYSGSLAFVKEDFYKATFDHRFDIVTYWNGFGVGDDTDNRCLLRKIADEWLTDGGLALVDIFNPLVWASSVGEIEKLHADPKAGYKFNVTQSISFDPVNNRFIDTWWETDKPDLKFTQNVRCYSPADLLLLLEGTGLQLERILLDDERITLGDDYIGHEGMLEKKHEYLAVLKKND